MRAIILADGESPRWGNYKGKPKHLIELYGKTFLKRITDQLIHFGVKDIFITTHNDKYATEGAKLWASKSTQYNIDKIWACQDLWDEDTLLICGDVFFTDEAMDKVVNTEAKDFRLFCRFGKNKILKSGGTEIFALRITNPKLVKKVVNEVREKIANKEAYFPDNTFTLYANLVGYNIFSEVPEEDKDRITELNDLTDDFDYPKDYDNFIFYINNGRVA